MPPQPAFHWCSPAENLRISACFQTFSQNALPKSRLALELSGFLLNKSRLGQRKSDESLPTSRLGQTKSDLALAKSRLGLAQTGFGQRKTGFGQRQPGLFLSQTDFALAFGGSGQQPSRVVQH